MRSPASASKNTPMPIRTCCPGGEQQRVALARAVAPRPSVLLMDEPFSGLDRRLRDEVREDTLNVLRDSRVTSVIVTHDPEEALRMGDRIALMSGGQLDSGRYAAGDLSEAEAICSSRGSSAT